MIILQHNIAHIQPFMIRYLEKGGEEGPSGPRMMCDVVLYHTLEEYSTERGGRGGGGEGIYIC